MEERKANMLRWGTRAAAVLALVWMIVVLRSAFHGEDAPVKGVGRVAVIYITGPIINMKHQIDLVEKYRDDESIKAIVLRIETPGGAIAASQELSKAVQDARKAGKLVMASLGNVAASGGYYVAAAADYIMADPGTLTGSIGVIMTYANAEELMKKIGVRVDVIKSGAFKDVGSPMRKITKAEETLLQDVIDDMYGQFVEAVVEGRSASIRQRLSEERRTTVDAVTVDDVRQEVKKIADGRVFSGLKAKSLSLVDELGNFQDAIQAAAKRSGIPGKPAVVTEKKPFSVLDYLLGESSDSMLQSWLSWVPLRYQLSF